MAIKFLPTASIRQTSFNKNLVAVTKISISPYFPDCYKKGLWVLTLTQPDSLPPNKKIHFSI